MNDEKIIARIAAGDESAIDGVINKYSRLLWHIASAVLEKSGSVQDVEECVADVFIHLWQHPDKYDPARGSLKVWLSACARSRAIDRYRAITKRQTEPLDDNLLAWQLGLADALAAKEEHQALLSAVQALDEPDREILIRRYFYEQKPRDIALALDLPVKNVENRLYRTKLKLRETISR